MPLKISLLSFCPRSPGGTPARRRRSKGTAALLSDPAAIIAEALKKKFSYHQHNNSSDKENSVELSPFGSPEKPWVSFTHTMLIHLCLQKCIGMLKIFLILYGSY